MEIDKNKLFFLRGLGIGIIITTLICCLFPGLPSDAEIIDRAKKLGMVEESDDSEKRIESVLSKTTEDVESENVVDGSIDDDNVPLSDSDTAASNNVMDINGETTPQNSTPVETITPEPIQTETVPDTTEIEYITIEVESGMASESVTSILVKNGLVDDASAFNKYLTENGYAQKIRVGKFEIPKGAEYKEVAEALIKNIKR